MHDYYRTKLIARLLKNRAIDPKTDCWLWTRNIGNHGYGTTHFLGTVRLVHRLSAIIFLGLEIDSTSKVQHKRKCKNKKCFNPDHLKIIIKE